MPIHDPILCDALLHRFAERAPAYDKENRFFHEDFADLQDAGYLTMAVPCEFGGDAPKNSIASGISAVSSSR